MDNVLLFRMLMRRESLFLFFFCLVSNHCFSQKSNEDTTFVFFASRSTEFVYDTLMGLDPPFENLFFEPSYITVDEQMKVDSVVHSLVASYTSASFFRLSSYYLQFVPVIDQDGKRRVWLNFIPGEGDSMMLFEFLGDVHKKELYFGFDGLDIGGPITITFFHLYVELNSYGYSGFGYN